MADQNDQFPNVNIYGINGEVVDVIADGSLWRLAVDAAITGGNFQLQPFIPLVDFDATGVVTNTSTWDTLVNETGHAGKLDFIALSGSSSQYRVRLTIDGAEIFDIAMSDLSDIGLSNATNVEMWAETADKNFRYHPNSPVDFTDNMKIEVKAVTATPTVKHLIMHRDAV